MRRQLWMALALTLPLAAGANTDRIGLILEQQRDIRENLEKSDGAYARFQPVARERLSDAQDQVFALLAGVSSIEQLHPEQRKDLFNALEEIKAVIAANEDDRQDCRRTAKLGTHMRITRCATVAERRQLRQGAQDWQGEADICALVSAGAAGCGNLPDGDRRIPGGR